MQLEAVVLKDILPYLRARRTFLRRAAYAGTAAFIVIAGGAGAAFSTAQRQSGVGGTLFDVLLWFILIACAVECTLLGAVSISSERQRNAVDVWILAGMEHFGMVAAKALSVLTRVAQVVLAPAVPAAVALYLGGRSITDATVAFLAVISIMIFTTALSVSVSSLCRRNSDSVPAAIAAALGFAVAPALLLRYWAAAKTSGSGLARGLVEMHPFSLLLQIGEVRGPEVISTAFTGLFLSCLASLFLLIVAGANLKSSGSKTISRFQPIRGIDRFLERLCPSVFHLIKPAPGDVDADPIAWRERLALANGAGMFGAMTVADKAVVALLGFVTLATTMSSGGLRLFGIYNLGAPAAAIPYLLGGMYFLVTIAAVSFLVRASQAFSRELETGQLDLIRLTRLEGQDIITGKMRAYARHFTPVAMMALPWAAVVVGQCYAAGFWSPLTGNEFLGNPWLRALGWLVTGFGAAAIGLFASLYFLAGIRSLYAAVLFYFVPAAVMFVFTLPFMGLNFGFRLFAQAALGLFILTRVAYWAREHRGYNSKHECLVLVVVGSLAAAASGPVIGPFILYLLAYSLMRRNFDRFVSEGIQRYGARRRYAMSWEYEWPYVLTHLGVPPAVEARLMAEARTSSAASSGSAPGSKEAPK